MSKILIEDLENIINDDCVDWDQLNGRTILVTGATGLVGSLLVKALAYRNQNKSAGMRILAMIRNREKADDIFGSDAEESGIQYVIGDIRDSISIDGNVDFIIHGASITQSKEMVSHPVETIFIAVDGTKNVLELAKEKQVKSMVYISSMEMYGITDPQKALITENDLGYINHLSVRSSYSEGKRCCEMICAAYCKEYGIPVKIARLAQTFGAGVSHSENRVFAQFAKHALNGEDIVLHTKGESYGNYCYTADVVRGLLCLLTKGEDAEAYTLVNEETTRQIKDMALMVADKFGDNKVQVVFDIPEDNLKFGYAPDVTMHLSGEKVRTLGWNPEVTLEDMYRRMIKYWEEEE